jgi:hypothetical protein
MRLFRRETDEDKWIREHPFGEEGSVDYWTEVMKRAVSLGETRAQGELDKLAALTGPQPPREWLSFPDWFGALWINHLAPYSGGHQAMPY